MSKRSEARADGPEFELRSARLARVEVTARVPQPEEVSELVRADIGAIRLSRLLVAHKAARPKEFGVVPRGGLVRWDCCAVVDVGEKAYEARANRPRPRRAVPVAHRRGRLRLVVENRVKLRLFGRVDQSRRRLGHLKAAPKALRLLEIHGARVHCDDAGALTETIETIAIGRSFKGSTPTDWERRAHSVAIEGC